ncbi:MAG: hypothetical protein QOG72_1178 [Sphingomonadales bacterium]|nr:hypothetical protein [Sphingomonadales bacterium]
MSAKARIRAAVRRRLLNLIDRPELADPGALDELAKRVRLVELNVKAFGYDLARRLTDAFPPPRDTKPVETELRSKAATQADIESDWARHWIGELKTPIVYHRKIWELAFVLQAIWQHGHLATGRRGLGFGCGTEPIASYLAAQGVAATITDLPSDEATAQGWVGTDQHATDLDSAFHPHLVERIVFDRLVELRVADMNEIPPTLRGYDFCWSVCAAEHLGSIDKGMDFLENCLETVRPGGLSVHTVEFNIDPTGPTLDHTSTVMFQSRHLETLAARLRAKGHEVAELDFGLGGRPLDGFIDVGPFSHELPAVLSEWLGQPLHLKVGFHGYATTCFGVIVRKAG